MVVKNGNLPMVKIRKKVTNKTHPRGFGWGVLFSYWFDGGRNPANITTWDGAKTLEINGRNSQISTGDCPISGCHQQYFEKRIFL